MEGAAGHYSPRHLLADFDYFLIRRPYESTVGMPLDRPSDGFDVVVVGVLEGRG